MSNYKQVDAINFSTLKEMKKSPLEYKLSREISSVETEAMRLGTFIHCGLLEPHKLNDKYVQVPGISWGSKAAKAESAARLVEALGTGDVQELVSFLKEDVSDWVETICKETLGKTPVPAGDFGRSDSFSWDRGMACIEANRNKRIFLSMLDNTEAVEKELYATCPVTGLKLKGLVDVITSQAIVDVKTIGSLGKMYANIRNYSYLGQLAYYDYLARLNGIEKERFFIIFIQTTFPYKMKVMEIQASDIRAEHELNMELLARVKECMESNSWPDGSDEIVVYEAKDFGAAPTFQAFLDEAGQSEYEEGSY